MVDQSHLSDTQKALIAPIVTYGSFYYFNNNTAALNFIKAMLTAIIEAAPSGYKFLKVTFYGSISHGRGYNAAEIIAHPMQAIRARMVPKMRITIGYELQVSREVEVAQEANDV